MRLKKSMIWPGKTSLFMICLTLTLLIGGVAILGTPDGDVLATSHYTSEGVEAHGADIFHKQTHKGFLPSNNRVKIGIIDTGFMHFSSRSDQELPSLASGRVNFNCFYQDGSGNWQNYGSFDECEAVADHGTNVSEIIIDMAPGRGTGAAGPSPAGWAARCPGRCPGSRTRRNRRPGTADPAATPIRHRSFPAPRGPGTTGPLPRGPSGPIALPAFSSLAMLVDPKYSRSPISRHFPARFLVLQRRFLNPVSFWPEIASRKARPQSCQARWQVAMKRCSRSLSGEPSL